MPSCTIIIEDEVNIRLTNLDLHTRQACKKALEYFLPHARYSPAFKLGRWSGTTSFCTIGGRSYLSLLDNLLPIVQERGYDIIIDDRRQEFEFEFDPIYSDFLSHLTWPDGHRAAGESIVLRDYQVQLINECLANPQGLIMSPTASGKCQPLYSKIKIPGGWTTMGEINVGDSVTIPNGSQAKVVNIYDPGIKDIYEITFDDGRQVRACGNHIFRTHTHDWVHGWKNISVDKIIEYIKTNKRDISIQLATMSYDNNINELPMPPYLLGALLGNGSFRNNIQFTSTDKFVLNNISGMINHNYVLQRNGTRHNYTIKFKSDDTLNKFKSEWMSAKLHLPNKSSDYSSYHMYNSLINQLGLLHVYNHTKFVPPIYLNASYNQRLDMIRGLLDTNGRIDQEGNINFITASQQLADDFSYLIRSIGGKAWTTIRKNRSYKYKERKALCKDQYVVLVYHQYSNILVTSPEKLDMLNDQSSFKNHGLPLLHISNIEKICTEPVRCIMIDHPDHLYVTDNFIVTHNTIVTSTLSMMVQKYGRSVVIVPNKSLVLQTEEDYINIGLDVGVLYGDRKEYDKTHTICTWQSLNILNKKEKDALDDGQLDIFMNDLVAVICDEIHLVKNENILHGLLTTTFAHIPLRWGLTGTIPEEDYKRISLCSAIGPVIGSLTAKELQDSGHLAQCHVNILQTTELQSYKTYHEELKFLVTNKDRLNWLAKLIQNIALSGNTLILIDRIETGRLLHELIPDSIFISGNIKASIRKDHYKEINLDNNAIMIATFGTTSTGISINRIFNLVLLEPGKSFVRVIQSIGRGLRKADDKDSVNVYDISSKCKFSNKHLLKRVKFYKDVKYPHSKTVITY